MKTAHTGGEWQQNGTEVYVELAGGDLDGYEATIAQCGVSYGLSDADMVANAAHIVACYKACKGINPEAVPDMLKSLKAIGDVLSDLELTKKDDRLWSAYSQVISTIAKTRGAI